MKNYFHSVVLDADLCCGCTNCLKRCPTEAIRIRDGKAHILSERCIDCGECIRICPHHAKRARSNSIEEIKPFKVKIAIPAPALFGQFNNLNDIDIVLTGLRAMGFDVIYEVSRAAELVSEATRQLIRDKKLRFPIISSACPAIVRLIKIRFPELCGNVMPLLAPMEIAARMARREVIDITGLSDDDIGVFFITPCPAKVTEINNPNGCEKSAVTGAIAISQIYPELTSKMDKLKTVEPIEELEDEHIHGVDFIELNACSGGCVGGVLAVENPYVAQARIQNLRKYLPVSLNHLDRREIDGMKWENELEFNAESFRLSDDIIEAMDMMEKMEEICKTLPGLDCGSCGAPTCRALAEDIVKGIAKETECIHKLKAKIQSVYDQLGNL